jgi:hypothetical protein
MSLLVGWSLLLQHTETSPYLTILWRKRSKLNLWQIFPVTEFCATKSYRCRGGTLDFDIWSIQTPVYLIHESGRNIPRYQVVPRLCHLHKPVDVTYYELVVRQSTQTFCTPDIGLCSLSAFYRLNRIRHHHGRHNHLPNPHVLTSFNLFNPVGGCMHLKEHSY